MGDTVFQTETTSISLDLCPTPPFILYRMTERRSFSVTSSSTFTPPPRSFDEITPPIATGSGALGIVFIASSVDSNACHSDEDFGVVATPPSPDGIPLGFVCEDPKVVATPALHNPRDVGPA